MTAPAWSQSFLGSVDPNQVSVCGRIMERLRFCTQTHRSTDGSGGQQVSRSDVAAIDSVVSQLLLHGPVQVLTEKMDLQRACFQVKAPPSA